MGIGRQSLLPADSGCMHPTRTALEAAEGAIVGVQLGDPRRNGLFSCTNPDVPLQLAEDRGWCVLGGGVLLQNIGDTCTFWNGLETSSSSHSSRDIALSSRTGITESRAATSYRKV